MAIIHKKHLFTFRLNLTPHRTKVGHNRYIQTQVVDYEDRQIRQIVGYLYNAPIFCAGQTWYRVNGGFEYDPQAMEIALDTCGWPTVTTRQAMSDFLNAVGARAGVSMAKGKFSARYLAVNHKWYDIEREQDEIIMFNAARLAGAA